MKRVSLIITLIVTPLFLFSLDGKTSDKNMPIIDMHIHSYGEQAHYGIKDHYGKQGPTKRKAHYEATSKQFNKHNIVKAVGSGSVDSVGQWKAWDKNKIVIRGLYMNHPSSAKISVSEFEQLILNKKN